MPQAVRTRPAARRVPAAGVAGEALIGLEALAEAAECLRTLAHPHRLRIVELLLARERTVTELVEACGLTQPACSLHLRVMRDRGLVEAERRGRHIWYRVAEPGLAGIMACVRGRFGRECEREGAGR